MNDGDQSLVVGDELFVEIADRNMKSNEHRDEIVPLYYEMEGSDDTDINRNSIYTSMTNAYSGGNIGAISNNITKIWNSEEPDLDMIKILVMENNFTIDYAKTLYKPDRPPHIHKRLVEYTRKKVPYFFMYAKDKKRRQVEAWSDTTVNKLRDIIPDDEIVFKNTNVGKFNYKLLLGKGNRGLRLRDYKVVQKYRKLDLHKYFMINYRDEDDNNLGYIYQGMRGEIVESGDNIDVAANTLVKYLYGLRRSSYKTSLWECFGEELVENLKENIDKPIGDDWVQCEVCGKRIKRLNNKAIYCKLCAIKTNKAKTLKKYHKNLLK